LRVDKFINTVNITKRRTIAEDMCKSGVVYINDKQAKASKDVKVGYVITIKYLEFDKKYEVLQIPTTKTIPKSAKDEYIKEIS